MTTNLSRIRRAVLVLWALVASNAVTHAEPDVVVRVDAEQRTLAEAVRLAPALGHGVRAVLIDPELAPDPRLLAGLDAFVVRNADGYLRPAIYINRRSAIVRGAAGGSRVELMVLAAVIHHEARHLAGASEAEARRSELELFLRLWSGHTPASPAESQLARRYAATLRHAEAPAPEPSTPAQRPCSTCPGSMTTSRPGGH